MKIGIEITVSLLALITGYIATCVYFREGGIKGVGKKTFSPISRSRIVYIAVGILAFVMMLYMFSTTYVNASVIHQTKLLILAAFLLPIAAIDLKVQKIPNKFLLVAVVVRVILLILEFLESSSNAWLTLKSAVVAAIVLFVFFVLILLVFKNSIGMGDVKLFAVIGLYQGIWGSINSIFFSLVASFFLSIMLLIFRKKTRKDTISFGPCAFVGAVIAIVLSGI